MTSQHLFSDRDDAAAFWLVSLASSDLTPDQQALFNAWLSAPENKAAFHEAEAIWSGLDDAAEHAELIQMRTAALETFRRKNLRRWKTGKVTRHIRTIAASAAAAILILGLGLIMNLQPRPETYETGPGDLQIVALDDGSRLILDADTRVQVLYGQERRALTLLQGRAKFDVVHDPLRPFTVTAADRTVVAIGTTFSVELLDSDLEVRLYEGRVNVIDNAAAPVDAPNVGGSTALEPGQVLTAPRRRDVAEEAVVDHFTAVAGSDWENGSLVFDNEPLADAIQRVNRYSRTTQLSADASAGALKVSGVFSAGDVNGFIEGVSVLHPVQVKRLGNTAVFTSNDAPVASG